MTAPQAAAEPKKSKSKSAGYVDRWYHPRIWHGLRFMPWMRLLFRNRCAVGPHMMPAACIITLSSVVHSTLRLVQGAIYGRAVKRTEISEPPLFILGHWRSGTTFLHELLALDEHHACPTSYECFAPHHFLLTEGVVTRYFSWVMPKSRPMDNMPVGWARPQEDEFALCADGQPTPYWTLAFPNHPPQAQEYLDFQGVPAEAVERWKRSLVRFVKLLAYRHPGRRAVLKSPPHTGRVKVLLEAFPEARFIHIVRDPYALYQSTFNMWKRMYDTHGLHRPKFRGLADHVFNTLVRMYEAYEEGRRLIAPERLYEVRYEDLVRDPKGQVGAMYRQLQLGDFDAVLPALEGHLDSVADYKPNRYEYPPELREEIGRRWSAYIEQYGYGEAETPAP